MLTVTCPRCSHKQRIPNRDLGSQVSCQECGKRFLAEEEDNSATPTHTSERSATSEVGRSVGRIIAAVLVCVLVFGLCAWMLTGNNDREARTGNDGKSTEPTPKRGEEPVVIYHVGDVMELGDVRVHIRGVLVQGLSAYEDGQFYWQAEPALLVWLHIKNTNPNRIATIQSMFGASSVRDDLGNRYQELKVIAGSDRAVVSGPPGEMQMPRGSTLRLQSDKPTTEGIVYEKPVPGATKLFIDVDAKRLGGRGYIRIESPKTDWSKPLLKS